MAIHSKSHAEFIAQVSNDVSRRGPWQIKHNQFGHHDVSYRFGMVLAQGDQDMIVAKNRNFLSK